ncbi:MAG TPA: YqaE/Pmp3 family membrane protein [Sediminibacterium sp.]|nr:YqaE/Pmp3 family membrane protein [Sediminibacterium sp.]
MKNLSIIAIAAICFIAASSAHASEFIDSKKDSSSFASPVILNDAVVDDALLQFKSLKRVERKERVREVKRVLKDFKAQKAAGGDVSTNTVLLAILAVLLPPLAVGLHEHALNGKFWLSVLLTLLFWLPGIIYALIVVLS